MPRVKDFENHIKFVSEELQKAEAKVTRLKEQLEGLEKQRAEYEMGALYKYMQVHSLKVKDIVPNFESEIQKPSNNQKNTKTEKTTNEPKIVRSRQSKPRTLKNDKKQTGNNKNTNKRNTRKSNTENA